MTPPQVRTSLDYTYVQKVWGSERWIVNNSMYCGKIITVTQGHHTSLHFHSLKHETMYCLTGRFDITFCDEAGNEVYRTLLAGQSIVIEPNVVHQIFGTMPENVMIEFSTQHFDYDSYRVGPAA